MPNATSLIEFESGQVRPSTSPDGTHLFARIRLTHLEVFTISNGGLTLQQECPSDWNRLPCPHAPTQKCGSESSLRQRQVVSLADPHVDCLRCWWAMNRVMSCSQANPAPSVVSTAHRGQQPPTHRCRVPRRGRSALTTPGVGRATSACSIRNVGAGANSRKPVRIMAFFTDMPRALAVSRI